MKALYILFGLLLLATVSSDPSTPFLVDGYIQYSNGNQVNDPEVNLTNLNTGKVFTAEISTDYYQLIPVNISAGDVVRFEVTDGVTYNITNYTVTEGDLNSGGVFGFNLSLMTTAPGITGYAPESLVYDIENATRSFNITIDQVVDIAWLVNDLTVYSNESVTDASYTNTSAVPGCWNVSAVANNTNGTVMQTWDWTVTAVLPPEITSYIPETPVSDIEGATRIFNITVDQVVDVTWLINGFPAQTNESVTYASYTNISAVPGCWNVSAVANNTNGTVMQTWTWHVTPPISVLHALFVIYGEVFYENNINVDTPYVVVTNLNTSREFVADNRSGEHFYQIITDASEIHTGDVLLINGSKNGILAGSVNHTVRLNESRSGAIRVDINRGWADLQVTRISHPPYIFDNKTNIINATIANNGTNCAEGFNVSFAVNGDVIDRAYIRSLDARCTEDVTFNWTPDRTRDHSLTVTADSDGVIDESNEENNSMSMNVFVGVPDFTITYLAFNTPVNLYDSIIINATVANYGVVDGMIEVGFYIDDDDTPFDTADVVVPAGGKGSATTIWNATLAANHIITAVADPNNNTPEIDESNNSMSRQIFVDASDLTVTDITIVGCPLDPEYPNDTEPMFEYPNNVTATIANKGNLSADAVVEFHSELNISSAPIIRYLGGYGNASNDSIIQPGASKMRVHFIGINPGTNSYVDIYDKDNNTVDTINDYKSDYWSNWVDGDSIRIYAYIGATSDYVHFSIDKYEYIFENATISIDAKESINVSGIWHTDPAIITNELHTRYVMLPRYTISVIADPNDVVTELNESNNMYRTQAALFYPYDFTITNITFLPESPREGEPVTIDAAIKNSGFRSIATTVAFYVDGNLLSIEDANVEANKTEHVAVIWDGLPDINHLAKEHDITVMVDPNSEIDEQDEENNAMSRLMNITLANLTITNISTDPAGMIIGDTVDVIATIRNNENTAVNSTVWFCEENDSLYIQDYKDKPKSPIIHHITHQGALMMRAYYTATVQVDTTGGTVKVYINDRQVLTCTGGNYHLAGWTEWTSGSTGIVNITLVEEGVPDDEFGIDYSIDRYQTVFGNTGLTIPASECLNLSMNWTVIQKNPRLIVTTSNAINSTEVSVSGTDLAVTDVSVSDNIVWDGDSVNVNATLTNFGGMNASNFTVAFFDILQDIYDSDTVLITTENVSRLDAGNSMNVTVPWTASLKVGEDISYKHLIEAKVIPHDEYIEDNSTNNTGYSDTITVKRSRDFSVTDITFLLNNETVDPTEIRIGELTTINASVEITNLASCGGSVDVVCYLDNTTPIGSIMVSFPAGNGTVHTEFEWEVCDHGNHTITVIADPENVTSEFDESNNASSQSTCIRAPDLVVMNLTFDPESPEEGEMVNITADVGNLGNKNVSDVTVKFIDESFTDRKIHTVPYMLDTPHPLPDHTDHRWVIQHRGAHKMRVHFTRLILPEYSSFYINENLIAQGCNITNLTVDWVNGDTIRMELRIDYSEGKWGFNMDRYEYMGCVEDVQIPSLDAGDMKNVTVRWNATPAGEHDITAIIDLEDNILESDESNNEFARTLIVQGADLTVSNMQVTANGTEINGTETEIAAGDVVNISAIVTNIGIRPASNFSVSFCAGDTEIANTTHLSLNMGEFVNVSVEWDATLIGNYTIAIAADSEKQVHETNESNNMVAMDVSVHGADLFIANTTYTVTPPGNATINDTCSRVYDTDTILINTTIANQGILPADNFSAHIFYEEKGLGGFGKVKDTCGEVRWRWINRTLEDAGCVYVRIRDAVNINGNIKIYDWNGSPAASPEGDGWFFVDGDEANVYFHDVHGVGISMDFYAGEYQRYDRLSIKTGQSMNLTMPQQVSTGDHPIRVFVDLEDRVCENSEENNYADTALTIHPSRDFAINDMQLFHDGSPIGVNDTIMDGDHVFVDVTVGMGINKSDPYHEYRTGDADVAIIGEHEWVNVSPRFELTPYGYAQVITHPGADAIKVHFDEMRLALWAGCVEIRDKNGTVQWSRGYCDGATDQSSWVDGDTIYVYNVEKATYYDPVWGRTTFSIDKYRYRRSNHTIVSLDADESRYLTTGWDVSAGSHTMQAAIDIKNAVGEINESNNEICRTLHVDACKDPAILNITFNPKKPAIGSNVAVNATIINKGNCTATFRVDLWAEKTEHHPFESLHDEDFPPGNCEWEILSTYPAADWMGIHFARIEMSSGTGEQKLNRNLYVRDGNNTMADNFCGSDETYVWTWVKGDTTKLSTTPCTLFPGYPVPVWGFEITDHRYRIVLNHTTLTLAPNETANVTGMLRNVRAGNHSINYTIRANLDTDNTVYEMNESNNEMVRILNLSVADFKVDINPPTKYSGISAVFRNIGFGNTDARIFFSRDVDYSIRKSGSLTVRVPSKDDQIPDNIDVDDIDWTRVHFKKLNIKEGGYLEVENERYEKSESDFWSPWVRGDHVRIKYTRTSFEIDRYEFAEEDFIHDFSAGRRVRLDTPWEEYTEPYNLTVWIDPFDEILEGNEDNNKDTALVYTDLVADKIEFVSPAMDKLNLDAEKFVIDGYITNGGEKDSIAFPVSDFNVTLEVRKWHPDDTVGESVFNITEHIDDPFYAGVDAIRFEFDPNDKFEVGGNYIVQLIADSSGDVYESNEENNITSEEIFVYNFSGYTGGGDLINIAQGEVHGRVVYTVGDSSYGGLIKQGEVRTVKYTGDIPDNADDIELARLFVYWFAYHKDPNRAGYYLPEMADVDMTFNGNHLVKVGNYSDNPGATNFDIGYGLYSYDVTNYVIKGDNEATVKNNADCDTGVHAIGLLVVYEDEEEPLTKYWINEGADVMMAGNGEFPTGLPSGDCITTASFKGVERNDTENVCATLLTVLGMYSQYDQSKLYSDVGDALEFNDWMIGSLMDTGHWEYQNPARIACTGNQWDDVTDYLKRGDNLAEIYSKGNYMLANNVFLRLIFPPELKVTYMDAPVSAVIGNEYAINVTINNVGKSDANEFNVSFYSNNLLIKRERIRRLDSGDNINLQYNWKPMYMGRIYRLKVAADVVSGPDWVELDADNNVMTKNVPIVEGGFGNESGPMGEGGAGAGGSGEGEGVSLFDTIKGILMKGTILKDGGGGGGGTGEFSLLEWVVKIVVLTTCTLLVYTGYLMEKRRHNKR